MEHHQNSYENECQKVKERCDLKAARIVVCGDSKYASQQRLVSFISESSTTHESQLDLINDGVHSFIAPIASISESVAERQA